MMPSMCAIIPARAGSKSIPNKNLRALAGKPMIAYTIDTVLRSRYSMRCIVSTEDAGIAKVARSFGAEVPFLRPEALAADQVTDLPVFQHVLQELAARENYRPEIVVHLRPTSPLRRTEDLDGAIAHFLASPDVDCVRTVTPAPVHPLKMWRIDGERLVPFIPTECYGIAEAYNQPRQLLPKAYIQNGAVDVIRAATILEKNSMSGTTMQSYVMPEAVSVNIDSPIDFLLAEFLLKGGQS